MTKIEIINSLYKTYGKYGITRQQLEGFLQDGEKRGLPLDGMYNMLRMTFGLEFGEHEYFTIHDVTTVTGETEEEVVARAEREIKELEARGENVSDYIIRTEPSRYFIYPEDLKS